MYAIVRKDSKVEGTGDDRTVTVNRIRVTSAQQAKSAGLVFGSKPLPGDGVRIVTVDGQKLDFDAKGRMVAGGVEESKEEKAAASAAQAPSVEPPPPAPAT